VITDLPVKKINVCFDTMKIVHGFIRWFKLLNKQSLMNRGTISFSDKVAGHVSMTSESSL
jgi:hypothetical protein